MYVKSFIYKTSENNNRRDNNALYITTQVVMLISFVRKHSSQTIPQKTFLNDKYLYNINCFSLKQLCVEIIHVNHFNITNLEKFASPRCCHCNIQDGGSNSQRLLRYTNNFYIGVQLVMYIALRVIPTIYLSEYKIFI